MDISKKIFLHHHSFDPNENFSLEEHLLKETEENYVLFYQNNPSVILGHFQCIYKEVDLSKNLNVYRRISGGGCVYHDLGNLNISFIGSSFDPDQNLFWIQDFIKKHYQKEILKGSRQELFYEGKKVSGSAFKKIKERSLHHYTLLCKSNLENLNEVLKGEDVETLGTLSQRAKVGNLNIEVKDLLDNIKKEFHFSFIPDFKKKIYNNYEDLFLKVPYKRKVFYKNTLLEIQCDHEKISLLEGPIELKIFLKEFSFKEIVPLKWLDLLGEVFYYNLEKVSLIKKDLVLENFYR